MAATFPNVIAFAFMAIMLLVGTILRARVPFLRKVLARHASVEAVVSLHSLCLVGSLVQMCALGDRQAEQRPRPRRACLDTAGSGQP